MSISYKVPSDLSDLRLYFLVNNVYELSINFEFSESERSFRFVWFEEFPWVCSSLLEDDAYCSPCVLFGCNNAGNPGL